MLTVTVRNSLSCRNFRFINFVLNQTLNLTRGQHYGGGGFSKIVPKLVYLHNPFTFVRTQIQLARLWLFWDRDFEQTEFVRGTKQSATVMTDSIRENDQSRIGNFTTTIGFQQITQDMHLSRNDIRLRLVQFRVEDFHRAIPMKVALFESGDFRNCFIDMIFVGMRNTNDFESHEERQLIDRTLNQLEKQGKIQPKVDSTRHRILFAEIYMRFFRNYNTVMPKDWSVSFYKIVSFDVLNFKEP